jgi:hypothetical protein
MEIVWIFVGFLVGIFVSALINVGKNKIGCNKEEEKITTGYWSTKTIDDKYINNGTSYTGKEENIKGDKNISHTGG